MAIILLSLEAFLGEKVVASVCKTLPDATFHNKMSFGSKDLLPRHWLSHLLFGFVLLAMVTIWICNQCASILSILFPCLDLGLDPCPGLDVNVKAST